MICHNCHKDVEGQWDEYDGEMIFICENCGDLLETEDSYADYVSDMKEESGRYRDDD